MSVYKDETIDDQTVNLDDNSYDNCVFSKCNLVYSGGSPPSMIGCGFVECKWSFSGAAERTLLFMKSVYHGMGEGGTHMIEKTFDNIRQPPK